MIRMSVFYPAGDDTTFDHEYYCDKHIPLALSAFGEGVTAEIDKGINGPYAAAAHFLFPSMEAMQAAMSSPRMGEIMGDIPNYTNTQPVMQVSEQV